jgi:hypothetical protein
VQCPFVVVLCAAAFSLGAQATEPDVVSPSVAAPDDPAETSPGSTSAGEPPAAAAPSPATTSSPLPVRSFRDDPAADAALDGCTAQLSRSVDAARACFREVIASHAGALAAVKAEASLIVLEQTPSSSASLIPPGRLGVTAASGLFGVWNGVAAGLIVGANAANVDGTLLVGGTGVGAVALGVAMGAGGYLLAERLKLDEGAARLLASSLVWGTVIGAGLAPAIVEAWDTANGSGPAVSSAVAAVVGLGYVGAGAALLATSLTTFDEAQVSMINSGGTVGALLGLLILPNLSAAGVINTLPYSLTFVGTTVAGLAGGAFLGRTLDFTWGETLLCDLGLVLGGVLGGTATFVVAPSLGGSPATTQALVGTSLPMVGVLGGYAATLAFVSTWRAGRGAPLWRQAPNLRSVVSLAPVGRGAVPVLGMAGEF